MGMASPTIPAFYLALAGILQSALVFTARYQLDGFRRSEHSLAIDVLRKPGGVMFGNENHHAAPSLGNRGNIWCLSQIRARGNRLSTLVLCSFFVGSHRHHFVTSISVPSCLGEKVFRGVVLHYNLNYSKPLVAKTAAQLGLWLSRSGNRQSCRSYLRYISVQHTPMPQHVCFASPISVDIRTLMRCSADILSLH